MSAPPSQKAGWFRHEAIPTAPQTCLRETPLSGALPCCFTHSVLSGSSLSWSVLTWDLDQSWVHPVQESSHVTWLGLALGAAVQKPASSRDGGNYTSDFPACWPCPLLSTPYLDTAMVSPLSTAKARIPRAGLSPIGLGSQALSHLFTSQRPKGGGTSWLGTGPHLHALTSGPRTETGRSQGTGKLRDLSCGSISSLQNGDRDTCLQGGRAEEGWGSAACCKGLCPWSSRGPTTPTTWGVARRFMETAWWGPLIKRSHLLPQQLK